jgi:hypothetical protein
MAPPWVQALEDFMGWPHTAVNERALLLWAASEGLPDNANNWLAESTPYPGSYPPPAPYSVPFYYEMQSGVDAIGQFLEGSNYADVRAKFQQGTSLLDIYFAIRDSKWCSGCQGGNYPIQLWQAVSADIPSAPFPPPPSFADPSIFGQSFYDQLMIQWWKELAQWVEVDSAIVLADILGIEQALSQV